MLTREEARHTIDTDDYGPVPQKLYRKLKKLGVTPAEWDSIDDAFNLIADQPIDYRQAERWIDNNTHDGRFQEPYPLNPVEVVTA